MKNGVKRSSFLHRLLITPYSNNASIVIWFVTAPEYAFLCSSSATSFFLPMRAINCQMLRQISVKSLDLAKDGWSFCISGVEVSQARMPSSVPAAWNKVLTYLRSIGKRSADCICVCASLSLRDEIFFLGEDCSGICLHFA